MGKVIFTTDTFMTILKGVFADNDLDTIIDTDRTDWKGKKLSQVLNIDYYTHKHVAPTTEDVKNELMAKGADDTGQLDVLKRSFCLISLDELQRLYSKDIDQIAVQGTMQFWLQAEKVKLLEAFIETANIALCGEKITIELQGETRKATLFFGGVETNIEGQTEIGESAIATISVNLMLTPNVASYSDYQVEFLVPQKDNLNEFVYKELPITGIQLGNSMTGKSIPLGRDTTKNNQVNLSNATVFTISYDGMIDNEVIQMFAYDTLSKAAINIENEQKAENQKVYTMRLTRLGIPFIYSLRMKDNQIATKNDTGTEMHTTNFTTGE